MFDLMCHLVVVGSAVSSVRKSVRGVEVSLLERVAGCAHARRVSAERIAGLFPGKERVSGRAFSWKWRCD
jgi:hypothetical protein